MRLRWWYILYILFFVISIYNIIIRTKWDFEKKINFILDLDYFLDNNLEKILNNLNINYFSFYYDNLSKNIIFSYPDIKFFIKLFKYKKYNFIKIDEFIKDNSEKIVSFIFLPNKYEKYFGNINILEKNNSFELLDLLEKNNYVKLNFEFNKENIRSKKLLSFRTFIIDFNNFKDYDENKIINITLLKIRKAIFERSCKLIYIIPSNHLDDEKNINIINKIVYYFRMKNSVDFDKQNFRSVYLPVVNKFFGVFFSIYLPIFIYRLIFNKIFSNSKEHLYFLANFLILLGGIFLWGLMQKYEIIALEERLFSIKIIFILPLILFLFFIFNNEELNKIFYYNVGLKHILLILFLTFLIIYVILRTDNVDEILVFKYEKYIREYIENFILFRPRFKEFLFFQPLFFLSLYLIKKYNNLKSKIFFCFSILSQTSIINTFLHLHTPLILCILRSLIGIILGFLFGYFYIFLFKVFNFKL